MKKYLLLTTLCLTLHAETNQPPAELKSAPLSTNTPPTLAQPQQASVSPQQIKRLVQLAHLLLSGQIDEHGDYNTQAVARSRVTQLLDAARFEQKSQENLKEFTELVELLDRASGGGK